MTRMTGPDCVVMCNLINTYINTYIHTYVVLDRSIYVQFSARVLCVLQINRSGLNQLYPIIYIYVVVNPVVVVYVVRGLLDQENIRGTSTKTRQKEKKGTR